MFSAVRTASWHGLSLEPHRLINKWPILGQVLAKLQHPGHLPQWDLGPEDPEAAPPDLSS
jgi:hypothetical protein